MRVWVGPVSKRLGGVNRYVHSLVTNSSSEFRVVREFRELLWGIRWAGRRIPLVRPLYGEYQHRLRGVDVAHVHRSPLYAEAFSESQQGLPGCSRSTASGSSSTGATDRTWSAG